MAAPGSAQLDRVSAKGGYQTVNIGKMHTAPIRLPAGFEHRTVVENKNYSQGHHGPDTDDYDLYLSHHGLKRPALTYYKDIEDWPDRLQATVWPHDDDLFPDNYVGRTTVDYLNGCTYDRPLFLWWFRRSPRSLRRDRTLPADV